MSAAARQVFRGAQRRQFSLLTTMRTAARAFEPHPFQRMTISKSAKPDYGRMARERLVSASLFAPTALILLGWPMMAARAFDGHV